MDAAMGVGKNEWSCGYQSEFGGERIARRIRKATVNAPEERWWAGQGHGQEERSRPTLLHGKHH